MATKPCPICGRTMFFIEFLNQNYSYWFCNSCYRIKYVYPEYLTWTSDSTSEGGTMNGPSKEKIMTADWAIRAANTLDEPMKDITIGKEILPLAEIMRLAYGEAVEALKSVQRYIEGGSWEDIDISKIIDKYPGDEP